MNPPSLYIDSYLQNSTKDFTKNLFSTANIITKRNSYREINKYKCTHQIGTKKYQKCRNPENPKVPSIAQCTFSLARNKNRQTRMVENK